MRLALAPKELEHNDAGDPGDRQARQSEESDEEEFECEKHAFILIGNPTDGTSERREISIHACVTMRYRRDAEETWHPS